MLTNAEQQTSPLPARSINASELIFRLMSDDDHFRRLPVSHAAELGYIAELLNSYRFVTGRLLADNPEMVDRLRTFAPDHLATVQGDL